MTYSPQNNRKQKHDQCKELEQCAPVAKRARTKFTRDYQDVAGLNEERDEASAACSVLLPNKETFQSRTDSSILGRCEKTFTYDPVYCQQQQQQQQVSHNMIHVQQSHSEILRLSAGAAAGEPHINQLNFKYLPDLNAIENPHYYENNKLLFELYVERIQRSFCHPLSTSHI